MAQYKAPRLPGATRLPRLTLPGQSMNSSAGVESFLNQLPPQMQGTDRYRAGVPAQDMDTSAFMRDSSARTPSDDALRFQQTQALAAHKDYRDKLQATQQQVNTRQDDLRVANNMLIATDPAVDKSVRKFMLRGLSEAVGVDPKGDYSKRMQEMVLSMNPESLEAMRSTFGDDIRTSGPGEIQQKLKGLFDGTIPVENVLANVEAEMQRRQMLGAAMTAPAEPVEAQPSAETPPPGSITPTAAPVTARVGKAAPSAQVPPTAATPMPSVDVPGNVIAGIEMTPGTGEPIPPEPELPEPPQPPMPVDTATLSDMGPAGVPSGGEGPPVQRPDIAAAHGAIPSAGTAGTGAALQQPPPGPQDVGAAHGGAPAPTAPPAAASTVETLMPPAGADITSAYGGVPPPTTTGAVPAAPAAGAAPTAPPTSMTAEEANRSVMGGLDPAEAARLGTSGQPALSDVGPSPEQPLSPEAAISKVAPQDSETTTREEHANKILELNARPPTQPTQGLRYVKPEDRDLQDRPVAREVTSLIPGLDPKKTYHHSDIAEVAPRANDSKEYIAEVRKVSKEAYESAFDTAKASMEHGLLLESARQGKLLGGADMTINIPYVGRVGIPSTAGEVTSLWERMKSGAALDGAKVSDGMYDKVREEASRFAAKQLAGKELTGSEEATLQAMLESSFLKMAFANARANNNGGKQITDKDLQAGMAQSGNAKLTAEQNIALNRSNTDSAMSKATRSLNEVLGGQIPLNWDKMSPEDRSRIIQLHTLLGNNSPLDPSTFKAISQSQVDYNNEKQGIKPDASRFLRPQGDTEEHYRRSQQSELSTKYTHEQNVEARAAREAQLREETHALQQQKYIDARMDKMRAEAEAQRKQFAQALQHVAAQLQHAIKGMSMPAASVGGGEQDTGAFRMTPTPQRAPPRVGGVQLPQRTLPQINVKGSGR